MASVKISELNELGSITSDDFIAIVDSGSGTTYRVSFTIINSWMNAYGSASHALWADNALNTISASYARSSSLASRSISSSYALTASYYDLTGYTPLNALTAITAQTASSLQGNGTSWERLLQISSSLKMAQSSSLRVGRKMYLTNPAETAESNAIWFNDLFGTTLAGTASNDFATIYFTEPITDNGRLVFSHGDNVDSLYPLIGNLESVFQNNPGFLWTTREGDGGLNSGSLMFLTTGGDLYTRRVIGRDFTASVLTGEGFYGTASWATNLVGGVAAVVGVPPIGSIMDYAGTIAPSDPNWIICDGRSLDTTINASLFAVIAYTWGGAGANFNIPDLRKKTTFGSNGAQTMISGTVGNTGGSEKASSHYHAIGNSTHGFDGSPHGGLTSNDDIAYYWIGNQSLDTTIHFPQILSPYNDLHRTMVIVGADSNNIYYKPESSAGHGISNGWCLGTSYALSEVGTDMMPPYAVVNKIIRIA